MGDAKGSTEKIRRTRSVRRLISYKAVGSELATPAQLH